jgi:putative nucleotidyltransferase-like protein
VADRIAWLAERIDEPKFAAFLRDQRTLLLFTSRLIDQVPTALSDDFRARLRHVHRDARARSLVYITAGRHLIDELERAGIPAVELKGAALAGAVHGDEALRTYDDVDVLVPLAALNRAGSIARELGWDAPGLVPGPAPPELHLWHARTDGALPILELHWRVHWYETGFAGAALERSRVVNGVRRLDPIDQLASLLLFYARDGFAGLRLPADIGAWWDRYGDHTAVPAWLERLMAEHPALAEPWRASLLAVAAVVGLPSPAMPASVRERGRRATLASRLRNWDLRGDVDQIKANVNLVDGLLTPREEGRAFMRRHVLVPTSYLTQVYGVRPDATLRVALWRAWHVAKTCVRYALGLWGVRRGRYWSPVPAPTGRRDAAEGAITRRLPQGKSARS